MRLSCGSPSSKKQNRVRRSSEEGAQVQEEMRKTWKRRDGMLSRKEGGWKKKPRETFGFTALFNSSFWGQTSIRSASNDFPVNFETEEPQEQRSNSTTCRKSIQLCCSQDRTNQHQDIIKGGDQDKTETFGVWDRDKTKTGSISKKKQQQNQTNDQCLFFN